MRSEGFAKRLLGRLERVLVSSGSGNQKGKKTFVSRGTILRLNI